MWRRGALRDKVLLPDSQRVPVVMEDEDCWQQLEDYRLVLIKTIEPSRITPYLRQCRVLSSEDEEQIFNDPSLVLRRRRVGVLLDLLQRTGVKGHVAFLESLELDYPHLYRKITGKEPARAFSILVDTVGESGLTQFLMAEVTRLQNGLAEERRRRQEAAAAVASLQDAARQQHLKERERQTQQERLQRLRGERERLLEELRHLKDDNYSLMRQITKLSEEKNGALMASRDLQLEIERLKHSLMKAESNSQIQHRRTMTLKNAMERWAGPDSLRLLSTRLPGLDIQEHPQRKPSTQSAQSQRSAGDEGDPNITLAGGLEDQQAGDQEKEPGKVQRSVEDQQAGDQEQEPGKVQGSVEDQQAGDQEKEPGKVQGSVEDQQAGDQEKEPGKVQGSVEDQDHRRPVTSGDQEHLSNIYSLRAELRLAEEQRDRCWEEKELLELKCTTLKKDTKMYCQRMTDILKQLEEVMTERNKAMAARDECHQENCRNLLEKDQYRRQIRELGERCDELQLQLFRQEGEVLALETRLRRRACTNHDGSQTTSEEESRQKISKAASSEDLLKGTSVENNKNITLQDHQRSPGGASEHADSTSQDSAHLEEELQFPSQPRLRCNFYYRRKRALKAKGNSQKLSPPHLDDSSGSDNTDWEGM